MHTSETETVALLLLAAGLVVALLLVSASVPAALSTCLVTGALLAGWLTVATTTGLGL